MRVAFIEYVLGVRGTQGTVWAYADLNERILGNESIVISRSIPSYRDEDTTDESILHFVERFLVYHVTDAEMDQRMLDLKIDVAYVVLHGGREWTERVPTTVPTITHFIFDATDARGTVRTAISEQVARGRCGVLPNIIMTRETGENLREELGIPAGARVFGRYGGYFTFDISWVKHTIIAIAEQNPDVYFLFMNTDPFTENCKNIIYLPSTPDIKYKSKFILTCDAMIHARREGETFGMACGEFAVLGRPVITYAGAEVRDKAHVEYLGDMCLSYNDVSSLVERLTDPLPVPKTCAYGNYTQERVAPLFADALARATKDAH